MSWRLFVNKGASSFAGVDVGLNESKFVVLGAPFDSTSSFRSGARFAPSAIRQAAQNLETYSFRAGVDVEEYLPADVGDVAVVHGDALETVKRVEKVVSDLLSERKIPIVLGGEHTVSIGSIKAAAQHISGMCLLVMDAHADLRDEYLGYRLSHACVLRRVLEFLDIERVMIVGLRAVSREEMVFINENKVNYVSSLAIRKSLRNDLLEKIRDFVSTCNSVYISLDVDVLDPSYAPGVQTPEPEGLTPTEVFDVIHEVGDALAAIDIVEVSPPYDSSMITSMFAAKAVMEFIAAKSSLRRP